MTIFWKATSREARVDFHHANRLVPGCATCDSKARLNVNILKVSSLSSGPRSTSNCVVHCVLVTPFQSDHMAEPSTSANGLAIEHETNALLDAWAKKYRGATVADLDLPPALSTSPTTSLADAMLSASSHDYSHL